MANKKRPPHDEKQNAGRNLSPTLVADFQHALFLHQSGRFDQAIDLYRQIINQSPAHADSWHLLGVIAHQTGANEDAIALIKRAIELAPKQTDYCINLANAQQALGQIDAAEKSLQQALHINPQQPVAHNNLGLVLMASGQLQSAETHLRFAATHGYVAAWSNLGSVLAQLGRKDEALACHEAAAKAEPDSAQVLYNLANAYAANGRATEAIVAYQRVLEIVPAHADTWNNLGIELGKAGQIAAAVDALRTAMQLAPDNGGFHSNLIFFLDYDTRASAVQQQGERRLWWQTHIQPLALPRPKHTNVADAQRKLRIGYVSADFWQHSAAFTFAPMLLNFNREHFEVVCYANQRQADEVTHAMRNAVTAWRDIADMDDASVAAQIQADAIDILIDLSAHSAGNLLPVFARHPAPVQITAWGHANGTGMPEIDALFTDAVTIPASQAALYAERLINLPCTLTYSPQLSLPEVSPLPALASTNITFGCFNRLAKLDAVVLSAWAKILQAVPEATLLIKTPELSEPASQAALKARAEAVGIAAERLILQGKTDQIAHLVAYSQVDICLDPFPHGGGISTFEALWMGVPVIALLGQTHVGRLAGGICSAVGLSDWLAANVDDYVNLAVQKSGDLIKLAALRQVLRAQVFASEAGNPQYYACAVEAVYRSLWREWCQQQ